MNLADIRRKAQAAEAQARDAQTAGTQEQGTFPRAAAPAPAQPAPAPQSAPAPPPPQETQAPSGPDAAGSGALTSAPAATSPTWEEPQAPEANREALDDSTAQQAYPRPSAPLAAPDREAAPAYDPYRPVPDDSTTQPLFPLLYEEAAPFDPAAVILKGRESATEGGQEEREAEQAEESLELLCFKVATEDYAISIMDIKEIIKPREVTEVPRVPPFVRGILSLRGIIIPVFDMRLRLGLPAGERSERERVIVVKRQSGFCGVLVDQVVQVVRIPRTGVEAPPVVLEGIDREFVKGIGRVSGGMLILLDIEKVLDVSLM